MQLRNVWTRALAPAFAAVAFALTLSAPARAQEEAAPAVLDEPVVQVNNDVIMLSMLKRENAEFRDVLVKQRNMTPAEADAEVAKKQPEIIFNLINEILLMQKGKDLPRLSEDIEADVNREVLRVAKGAGLNTLEELEAALRQEGMSLSDIKDTLRRQYTKQAVLQREVDARVYYGLTDAELRKYYEANRNKFVSVTLSEIFLSLAGRSEADVKAKAADLAARARAGADFGELAAKNSEREDKGVRIAETTKGQHLDEAGKPRSYLLSDVQGNVATALKDMKAGGVTDPIKTDEGYMILRVNEREETFKENFVRGMMTQERSEKEHEDYLRKLRQEAYIKPAPNYLAVIQPLLDKDKSGAEKAKQETAASDNSGGASSKKDKSKKQ
ncbi:MAG TPA: peptidyl-prolyl cis-trans isomerase [Pyrinomonadaceae bacterium]|nr:peptidyl-prolyl cis-trans isomerase [Pyrinomonadaceae bacterium]